MNRLLISLLLAGLTLGGVFFWGYRDGVAECNAKANREKIESVSRAIEQANDIARQDAEVSASVEKSRVIRETRYVEIERIVRHEIEKPVYSDCRLDACGLCIAAAAARDQAGTDCPCEPDYGLRSGTAEAPQRLDGRASGSLHLGSETVFQLPGSASGAGQPGEPGTKGE